MSEYRVFISHKQEDGDSATAVKDALGQFSGDLRFFVSGDSLTPGEDWRNRLRSELGNSDLLLLLFTEPTRNWDWCLYEVGLFSRLDAADDEPIVCLYHSAQEPPKPLVTLQGVPATVEDTSTFIRKLFTTTEITWRDQPLNRNLTDSQITEAARVICRQFGGNVEAYYASYRVWLDLPPDLAGTEGIPHSSRISTTAETMRVFGRTEGTETWGELVSDHRAQNAPWLEELDRAFMDACNHRVSPPSAYTLTEYDGVKVLRPQLYRIDKKGRRPMAAVVNFAEEAAPSKVGGPIFNRIRVAERYKTEVFNPFNAAGALTDDEVDDLVRSFQLIREEAIAHNVHDDESMRTSFPDPELQDALRDISAAWLSEADGIASAGENGNRDVVRSRLETLNELNNRYRAIVSRRYMEVLNTEV